MNGMLGSARERMASAAAGEVRKLVISIRESVARMEANQASFSLDATLQLNEILRLLDVQSTAAEEQAAESAALRKLVDNRDLWFDDVRRSDRDNIGSLRAGLETLRSSAEYARCMASDEPLVTVRIASYQRTEELIDVALASVLSQTYERLEVIVVNDGPNPETRAAIAALNDPRVRYDEFPRRNVYPEDRHSRWMVAGSPGMNRGAALASGDWIAPLDEDDSFSPDHIEKLLALAKSEQVELAYGALEQKNLINETSVKIWSFPPAISQFSFQSSIYLRALHPTFRYDEASWTVREPGDWNLIRRMTAAGVTMAATEDFVGVMNQIPYTHKDD